MSNSPPFNGSEVVQSITPVDEENWMNETDWPNVTGVTIIE